VSSKSGGRLRRFPGSEQVKALAWRDVQQIVEQFESLNPYDRSAVSGSILNFVDANFENSDPGRARRQLLGYSIAAKRYALYARTGNKINVVDPKATASAISILRPIHPKGGKTTTMLRNGFINFGRLCCEMRRR
jgi:hypothetical protein